MTQYFRPKDFKDYVDWVEETSDTLNRSVNTHDKLSELFTGEETSVSSYRKIIKSRIELERKQQIMEDHFARFGVILSKPSGISRVDCVTEEFSHLLVYTHTKLNPKWQHAHARQRRNQFLHFMKENNIKKSELHYFMMPAADSRLPVGTHLKPYIEEAKLRLRRTFQQIDRRFGDHVTPILSSLEWTIDPKTGIYLHFNVIMYVPERIPYNPGLPENDLRESIVWSKSKTNYSQRYQGLGQFLVFFNKTYRGNTKRFVKYNGAVRDSGDLLLYINKPFDPEPIKDNPEITQWLYEGLKGIPLYHTKGAFKAWLRDMKEKGRVVFEFKEQTFTRQIVDGDYHTNDDDDRNDDNNNNDDRERKPGENRIVGRMSPNFNYRYKTPSILVMNYNPHPKGRGS